MPRKKSGVEGATAAAPAPAKKDTPKQPSDRRIDDIFRSKRPRRTTEKPKAVPSTEAQAPAPATKPKKRGKAAKTQDATPKPKTAAKPAKAAKSQVAKRAAKPARKYLEEVELNGAVCRVGDSAYVNAVADEEGGECELEACEVCQKTKKLKGRKEVPLLECDQCLRGYHLDCLDPPLADVPKGDWMCSRCLAGLEPLPPASSSRIARDRFFAGKLDLARIEALWREPDGTLWFSGRWYYRPEETHTGRQKHHGVREVFLTDLVDNNEVECLDSLVPVCLPGEAHDYDGWGDVFVCEYEYDAMWKRFRRLSEEEADPQDAEWSGSEGEDSGDEGGDAHYKPIYAFWAEKGLIPSQNMRKKAPVTNAGRKRKTQGGDKWRQQKLSGMVGLGASQIPEASRLPEGSDLRKARSVLALTAAPKTLPCREAERDTIAGFVQEAVHAGKECLGKCLYVSGVPGTGKTASVLEVMRGLRSLIDAGKLPHFQFVELNSLRLPSPQHVYTHLYEALVGVHLSPGVALSHLEELFNEQEGAGRRKGVTVVLVDEVDLLVTRNQQVLYNLFEWPARRGSRLAVVAVANTMDLPERLLPRIASRLGGRRLAFQPYNRPQLVTIVSSRLKDAGLADTFAENAINMACSKVAGVSGDVRRVLQLCRKAAEICEEEGCQQVGMRHINLAVEDMFSAAHMQLLASCCKLDKMVLASLLLELRAKGRQDAVLEDVAFRLHQLTLVHSLPGVAFGDCLASARRLGAARLLLTELGGKRLCMRLALNVPLDDVVDVLQRDDSPAWLKNLNF